MMYQPELETLPREKLRALQEERLKRLVAYVYERVPFYRRLLDEAGVDPKGFRGLEDLPRIPFTKKTDLRDHYPFGLFAVPREEVARVHASSGTTGKPTVVGYTKNDLKVFAEVVALSGDPKRTREDHGLRAYHRLNPLALLRADLWLLGGGGLLQDATSALSLTYYLSVLRLARLFRKRVVVFNQSLGPLSPWGERRVRKALQGVPVILRDQDSLEYARRLGIPAALGADPALLLPPPPVPREEDLVLVIPRAGVQEEALTTLYVAANHLVHEGKQVLVLLLQPGYDDEVAEVFRLHRIERTSDPRRLLYLAAQAGYVISMRLHGLILAAAAGTPFAALSYDPKVAAFAKETGAYYQELPGEPIKLYKAALYGRFPDWEKVARLKERARQSFDLALGEGVPIKGSGRG